ncbi:hypothetical protein L228DRAFT_212804 [Xylona heveae TC161]|uniref:Aminoglycoside phosphotransferase domain-containing protein n=1 Tax=Xylona heveae (strain CBS 132557 / TC161) TaxID=1328760 RepID=A0A165FHP3_XYLHT|nr:hypothetical protein L228DRAFT_212804 [Xylona heveae TC161]KZF20990.1 hypothetical protein L228DRAFT_212804 [Xylona heveae TC161]
MPMWSCDFQDCEKPCVRNAGECILCDRHLCSIHLGVEYHQCPRWEDEKAYDPAAGEAERKEINRLIDKINISALAARASQLRNGISCSIPHLQYDAATRSSVMGGMNYHISINFADGVTWLARIRKFNATSPPPTLRDHIMESEVATLHFLERTGLPTPRVFYYAPECETNPVGVAYLLFEKMPGKSLRWSLANDVQRQRVIEQLADVFIRLHDFSFDLMGSLCLKNSPGKFCSSQGDVGAFARESLTDFRGSTMLTLGPYTSVREYHDASLRLILDLILREEIYAQRSLDAYLIHRFLLDLVPFLSNGPTTSQQNVFYLKHADDKGDHILVDEAYNITGIVDWEWAYTAPAEIAFNSPIVFFDVAKFYDGSNHIDKDEVYFASQLELKGHDDLAKVVRNGRLQHRFAFCCGYNLDADWDGFLGLFLGLRNATGVDNDLDWFTWKSIALERYKEDNDVKTLLNKSSQN